MWILRRSSAALLLAAVFPAAMAGPALAAGLTILSPASAAAGAKVLATEFTARTGIAVSVAGGGRDKIFAILKEGGPADVVILPSADFAALSGVSGVTRLGRIPVGVAVKAGSPAPDISTPEQFRTVLLAAHGVAYADPAAGTSAGKVIDRMLSAPEFSGVKRVPVQGLAVGGLTSGKADIALQMLPELAANKDVVLAGAVPSSYGAGVDFSAAISTASGDGAHAKALAEFLAAPQAARTWHANGLDTAAY
jgi:molybdate transport system substrate-binding protein